MKKLNILLMIVVSLFMVGCASVKKEENNEPEVLESVVEYDGLKYQITNKMTNNVLMELTDDRKVIFELYPEVAPISVENFQKLVKEDFYDGIIFHRVVKDFVVQAGDGTSQNKSAQTIKGEFNSNGVTNDLKHEEGVLSMARTSDKNSASSQFFVMLKDNANLDGEYAAFGKVIKGMNVITSIGKVVTDKNDKPIKDVTIKRMEFVKINE